MVTSARCVGFTARVHFFLTPSPFSVAGVLPAPRAWPLLVALILLFTWVECGWCAIYYLHAGNILGTLRSAHLELEGLPCVGRLWRSSEPVPGGAGPGQPLPTGGSHDHESSFSPPSIGSELRWGRITVHPLNPSN